MSDVIDTLVVDGLMLSTSDELLFVHRTLKSHIRANCSACEAYNSHLNYARPNCLRWYHFGPFLRISAQPICATKLYRFYITQNYTGLLGWKCWSLSLKANASEGRSPPKSFSFSTSAFIIQPFHQFRRNIKISLRACRRFNKMELSFHMNCVVCPKLLYIYWT